MRLSLLILLVLPISFGRSALAQADYVVHNAKVYTASDEAPIAEAFAVRGDRFVLVGTNQQILEAYPEARRIDASGRAIIPGLIDAHAHLLSRGAALLRADLVGTKSKAEVVERLRTFAATLPDGVWLTGRGWDQNDWEITEFPAAADLDAAFPDRPVWLSRIDGHAAWANTAAMRAAGLDVIAGASDPEGGKILRDAAGNPTGIFIDTAMNLVGRHLPAQTPAETEEALRRVLEETARYGLTGVHDAGVDLEDIEIYKRAIDEGRFDLRLYGMIGGTGEALRTLCASGPILDYGDRLTVRSVKMYIDGALGSRGAALLEPYADEPDNRGLLRVSPAQFAEEVRQVMSCGFQANTHAIGDAGNRVTLDAYESAMRDLGRTVGRHRIEHAQIVDPADIARFREMGIIASMQPTHATSDMYWADERLGQRRLEGAYAWRSFLDEGVRLAFGSDFPVEEVNPMLGFYAAVTRQDAEGWPAGGWLPQQRLTREEALRAFTIDATYAAYQEHQIGSISPGKLADFVILSKDIMTIPPKEILTTNVIATYLGGRPIYNAPN